MILKNGKNLGFQKNQPLVVPNIKWFATCTANITNINFMNPVPVRQKRSTNGLKS